MKKGNIGSALFTGIFAGVVIFIKELFFANTGLTATIIILALAALIGYVLAERIFKGKSVESIRKK